MTFRETASSEAPEAIHSEVALAQPKSRLRKGALPKVEAEPSGVELEDEEKAAIKEFFQKQGSGKTSLGDVLKDKFNNTGKE